MEERILVREGIFVEGPEGETLAATRCRNCGQSYFPAVQPPCPNCFAEAMENVALSRRGKLFSFTTVHMPSAHLMPPYAVGYVELPEGLRLFTPLALLEGRTFTAGMEMELAIGPLWKEEEQEVVAFYFRPV